MSRSEALNVLDAGASRLFKNPKHAELFKQGTVAMRGALDAHFGAEGGASNGITDKLEQVAGLGGEGGSKSSGRAMWVGVAFLAFVAAVLGIVAMVMYAQQTKKALKEVAFWLMFGAVLVAALVFVIAIVGAHRA